MHLWVTRLDDWIACRRGPWFVLRDLDYHDVPDAAECIDELAFVGLADFLLTNANDDMTGEDLMELSGLLGAAELRQLLSRCELCAVRCACTTSTSHKHHVYLVSPPTASRI